MKYSLIFWLLLVPAFAHGQDLVIGGAITKQQLDALKTKALEGEHARKALDALAAREVKLDVGVFFPFRFGNPNQLWLWSDESVCKRLTVGANQKFALWGLVAGTDVKESALYEFDAKPEAWGFLIGAKEGTTTLTVISNGEGTGPPLVLDRLTIIVGKGKPPPPPPDSDPFTKAANADISAGKGSKADLTNLIAYYRTIGPSLPADATVAATLGEFYGKYEKGLSILVGDKTLKLPTLRRAIGDHLNTAIPKDPALPFDAALRQKVADAFAGIANRLEGK